MELVQRVKEIKIQVSLTFVFLITSIILVLLMLWIGTGDIEDIRFIVRTPSLVILAFTVSILLTISILMIFNSYDNERQEKLSISSEKIRALQQELNRLKKKN